MVWQAENWRAYNVQVDDGAEYPVWVVAEVQKSLHQKNLHNSNGKKWIPTTPDCIHHKAPESRVIEALHQKSHHWRLCRLQWCPVKVWKKEETHSTYNISCCLSSCNTQRRYTARHPIFSSTTTCHLGKKWYHSQWLRTNTSLSTCTEDHQHCRTSWKTHHNWRCHRWRWWVWRSSSESKTTIQESIPRKGPQPKKFKTASSPPPAVPGPSANLQLAPHNNSTTPEYVATHLHQTDYLAPFRTQHYQSMLPHTDTRLTT